MTNIDNRPEKKPNLLIIENTEEKKKNKYCKLKAKQSFLKSKKKTKNWNYIMKEHSTHMTILGSMRNTNPVTKKLLDLKNSEKKPLGN